MAGEQPPHAPGHPGAPGFPSGPDASAPRPGSDTGAGSGDSAARGSGTGRPRPGSRTGLISRPLVTVAVIAALAVSAGIVVIATHHQGNGSGSGSGGPGDTAGSTTIPVSGGSTPGSTTGGTGHVGRTTTTTRPLSRQALAALRTAATSELAAPSLEVGLTVGLDTRASAGGPFQPGPTGQGEAGPAPVVATVDYQAPNRYQLTVTQAKEPTVHATQIGKSCWEPSPGTIHGVTFRCTGGSFAGFLGALRCLTTATGAGVTKGRTIPLAPAATGPEYVLDETSSAACGGALGTMVPVGHCCASGEVTVAVALGHGLVTAETALVVIPVPGNTAGAAAEEVLTFSFSHVGTAPPVAQPSGPPSGTS